MKRQNRLDTNLIFCDEANDNDEARNDRGTHNPFLFSLPVNVLIFFAICSSVLAYAVGRLARIVLMERLLQMDEFRDRMVTVSPLEALDDVYVGDGGHLGHATSTDYRSFLLDISGFDEESLIDLDYLTQSILLKAVQTYDLELLSYHCTTDTGPERTARHHCVAIPKESGYHISFHTSPDTGTLIVNLILTAAESDDTVVSKMADLVKNDKHILWTVKPRAATKTKRTKMEWRETENRAATSHTKRPFTPTCFPKTRDA